MVRTSSSTAGALRSLAEETPDLVVTDIAMPGEDGFALLHGIRHHANVPVRAVPVLAVTAYSSEGDRARMLAAAFDAKPVPARDLDRNVARFLGHVR